jgi:hypothetical protein
MGWRRLGHAGGAHRPLPLVEGKATRLPVEPAPGDQPPRDAFEVCDRLLVAHLEHRNGEDELLDLQFDSAPQRRVSALSKKAQHATLSPEEAHEPDDCLRPADLLAILAPRQKPAQQSRLGLSAMQPEHVISI